MDEGERLAENGAGTEGVGLGVEFLGDDRNLQNDGGDGARGGVGF